MKIQSVALNNRKRVFEVRVGRATLSFPFAKASPAPTREDPVSQVAVDKELGQEAFEYALASGRSGVVHVEQVLEYNQDPAYLRDLLLYKLTLEVQRRVLASPLSKREIIRRLGTSAAQFYRLLDPTNTRKSVDQLISLLQILDCEVDLVVHERTTSFA
jgi:hypothetical protein